MRAAGLSIELELHDKPVPEVVGGAAYRIVQESLTNVVRHAGPHGVGARARRRDERRRRDRGGRRRPGRRAGDAGRATG